MTALLTGTAVLGNSFLTPPSSGILGILGEFWFLISPGRMASMQPDSGLTGNVRMAKGGNSLGSSFLTPSRPVDVVGRVGLRIVPLAVLSAL